MTAAPKAMPPAPPASPLSDDNINYVEGLFINSMPDVARQRARTVTRFRRFLRRQGAHSVTYSTLPQMIRFIDEHVAPHATNVGAIQRAITAIDVYRIARDPSVPRWQQAGSSYHSLLARARRTWNRRVPRPVPHLLGDLPDTHDLVPLLPMPESDTDYQVLSERTLLLLRLCTLLRGGEIGTIERNSIKLITHRGDRFVRFRYQSKRSTLSNWETDSNYIEFTSDASVCPATHVLKLKSIVDRFAGSRHNRIFVVWSRTHTNYLKPISTDTARQYAKRLLARWRTADTGTDRTNDNTLRSHDLRAISAQSAIAAGIPTTQLQIRASWVAQGDGGSRPSSVLLRHYLSRFVPTNFAEVLLLSGTVIQMTALSEEPKENARRAERSEGGASFSEATDNAVV